MLKEINGVMKFTRLLVLSYIHTCVSFYKWVYLCVCRGIAIPNFILHISISINYRINMHVYDIKIFNLCNYL